MNLTLKPQNRHSTKGTDFYRPEIVPAQNRLPWRTRLQYRIAIQLNRPTITCFERQFIAQMVAQLQASEVSRRQLRVFIWIEKRYVS
jgi:hypothetical protein